MTTPTVTHDTFVIERTYDAPVDMVFRAWADPERKVRWFAGSPEALGTAYTLDFRVGGREVNRGASPDGVVYTYTAEFRDIVPGTRIVATTEMLADDTRISVTLFSVEFHDAGAATKLVLTEHGAYLDGRETAAAREHGTRALLDSLARSIAAGES